MPSTPENSAGESKDGQQAITPRASKKKAAKKTKSKLRAKEVNPPSGDVIDPISGAGAELSDAASPALYPVADPPFSSSWDVPPVTAAPELLPEVPPPEEPLLTEEANGEGLPVRDASVEEEWMAENQPAFDVTPVEQPIADTSASQDPALEGSSLLPGFAEEPEFDGLSQPTIRASIPGNSKSTTRRGSQATSVIMNEQSAILDDPVDSPAIVRGFHVSQPGLSSNKAGQRPGADTGSSLESPYPSPPETKVKSPVRQIRHNTPSDRVGLRPEDRVRRPPMFARQHPHTVHGGDPPLPHHPQAHFYSAPLADNIPVRRRGKKSSRGVMASFYAMDTLVTAGGDGEEEVENILLVGGHGSLDVFRLEKDRLSVIGNLHGLHGEVVGAKLLPRLTRDDTLQTDRPLVALTIHAQKPPVPTTEGISSREDPTSLSTIPGQRTTSSPEIRRGASTDHRAGENISHETTVEVFSLKTRERLAVLFAAQGVALHSPLSSSARPSPLVTAAFRVDANAKYIIIASGSSGELWIFDSGYDSFRQQDGQALFRCLAKIWTAVQSNVPITGPSTSEPDPTGTSPNIADLNAGKAVFSLSHRWLAYVPAKPAFHHAIQGGPVYMDANVKVPGLYSHTTPPPPHITCAVDSPDTDGLFNRVAREVTQEVIKGARWVGDQGLQAWRSYWNKPAQAGISPGHAGSNQILQTSGNQPSLNSHTFPPTHAHANQQLQSGNEPVLVSILDLARLDRYNDTAAQKLTPMATFQAPLGCSFLSFAPGGLHLLTASKNGDLQFIWDLMKIGHEKLGPPTTVSKPKGPNGASPVRRGPHVRQIAYFSRMTAASIVDVVWTAPAGERLAIVTDKGTVHMFDIPTSAFQWPPPRRTARAIQSLATDENEITRGNALYKATGAAGTTVTAAVKMVNDSAQPLLAAARGRRSSSGADAFGGGPSGPASQFKGVQTGGFVAQGLSKSLGAATETINIIRSIGENRLHIPKTDAVFSPGCVRWLTGRETGFIGMVGDGVVRMHEVRIKAPVMKGAKRQSLVRGPSVEHELPSLSDRPSDAEGAVAPDSTIVPGHWSLRSRSAEIRGNSYDRQHPLSHAEIETNSPYQPFHTDRRVHLFTYEASITQQGAEMGSTDDRTQELPNWVFGQAVPSTKVKFGANPSVEQDDGNQSEDVLGPMENVLQREKVSQDAEQLVITTRRRKRAKDGMGEDGFFEDDCEVLDFASDRV